MRIIHLLPGLMTGGQETMIINIANEQVKNHDVMVIIINKDYEFSLLKGFAEKVKLCLINRPRSSKNPYYFIKLNYSIIMWNPNIVHLHYEKLINYIMTLKYKVVYTIHDTTINVADLEKNRNAVAISKSVQRDVVSRTSLKPIVIYNGIKIENIKINPKIITYRKDKPYRILQVSRLAHEKKGQHILIQAVDLLQKKGYVNISLDFIGDGDSREYLKTLTTNLGTKHVTFLGNKPVEYVNEHLSDYNLFVQASLFEGFGLTVAEAIGAKVPVVVSKNEGPLEIVDNGKYGLTFENGSIEDCAKKIEEILTTPLDDLQKRINDAWIYVNDNFNVKATAANYIEFYKKCE